MSDQILIVVTTVETPAEANRLAERLVEERLAACVQIDGPLRSVYRWKDKTENAVEWRLSIKTVRRLYTHLEQSIAQQHPYEVPEVMACEVVAVSESYRKWLLGQLKTT